MEFEERNERNERPKEPSKNLPMAVLLVLVGIICALLYIGWKYMADDTSSSDELTPTPADSVSKVKPPKAEDDNEATATKTPETTTPTTAKPKPAAPTEGLPPISVAKIGAKKTDATPKTAAVAEKKVEEKKETPKPAEKVAATKTDVPAGGEITTHTVDTGETFLGIANRYNMKAETLKKLNPGVDPNKGMKVGITKLKIRIKAIHTVGPGDVLRVVSQKYNVSVPLIMAANKKTKNRADRGEQLIIPFSKKQ